MSPYFILRDPVSCQCWGQNGWTSFRDGAVRFEGEDAARRMRAELDTDRDVVVVRVVGGREGMPVVHGDEP